MGNPHDSQTLEPLLGQIQQLLGYTPREVVYDRAGRGCSQIGDTVISTPGKPLKRDMAYQKEKFRRRSAIEPITGHLKTDFRRRRELSVGQALAPNQCLPGGQRLEFEEIDGEVETTTSLVLFFLDKIPANGFPQPVSTPNFEFLRSDYLFR